MSELFLQLVNMSISAGWLVLAVLVLRLILKKAPKWTHVLLWALVAVRLVFPFSWESALSLIPSAETISPTIMTDPSPTIHSGIPSLNSAVNPILTETFAPTEVTSANPLQILVPMLSVIWLTGIAALLLYTLFTYLRLRSRVRTAVLLRENIYQSEAVTSPFVLGIIKPRIYLPFAMTGDAEHIIAHEQAHIRRRDHWWKPLGFLLLTVYWFNPLIWLAYVLLCRDIELACDEKVIKELGTEQRADYSQVLLQCGISRRTIAACPLAFGEVGVKARIKSVLHYKKPAFRIIAAALVVCAATAVCFLTDPQRDTMTWAKRLDADQVESIALFELPGGQWHTLNEEETAAAIQLIRDSRGRYVAEPEQLEGSTQHLYVTMTDGSFHEVWNMGNTYLVIDGDYYKAPYSRLVTWDGCFEDGYSIFSSSPDQLTLVDVIALSQKGQDLSWDDFSSFRYTETGSGLYIRVYEIDEMFSLWIGGPAPNEKPWYIYLRSHDDTEEVIDLLSRDTSPADVTDFIAYHQTNPVSIDSTDNWYSCPVGYHEDTFAEMVRRGFISEKAILSSVQYFPVVRIDSKQELDGFMADMKPYMNFEHSYANTPSFRAGMDAYNEAFFQHSSLLLIYTTEGNTANRVGVESIRYQDQVLSIGMIRTERSGDTAMEGWLTCIQVQTKQLSGVERYEASIVSTQYPEKQIPSGALIETYVFTDSPEPYGGAGLSLYDDGTFTFTFSVISSYFGYGTYETDGGRLTLNTSDGKFTYVFDMVDDTLVFDTEVSSEQTWFSGMYDGAVFEPS